MKRTAALFLLLALICVQFAGCSLASSPSQASLPYRRHFRNSKTPLLFEGRVVGIDDGDTITVVDSSNQNHRIRLAGIDAPEKAQAFGTQSKENLSKAVFNKVVTVAWSKHDRYGRIVGKVGLSNRDVCLDQVAAGLAWHYKDYEEEQTPEDRLLYAQTEIIAKSSGIGLWNDSNPIPPWEFRRQRR